MLFSQSKWTLVVNPPAFDKGLAPLPPGSQDEQGYNDLVHRSKMGVSQFDRLLTIVLAKDSSWLTQDRVNQAFSSVSFLCGARLPPSTAD
jgi:hypothetical protein